MTALYIDNMLLCTDDIIVHNYHHIAQANVAYYEEILTIGKWS